MLDVTGKKIFERCISQGLLSTNLFLRLDGTIRLTLRALKIHITVHVHARSILLHLLSPTPHILHECLYIFLFAQIDRLFILADLSDLAAGRNIRETEVVLVR
jgi:hypothetical protein